MSHRQSVTLLCLCMGVGLIGVVGSMLPILSDAEENLGLAREDLYVSEAYVDGGPVRKWRRFGARGRFKPQLKRSSHITIVLEEYEYE